MKNKLYKIGQIAVQFLYCELFIALVPVYIGMDAFGYIMPKYLFNTMVICGILSTLKFLNILRIKVKKTGLINFLREG